MSVTKPDLTRVWAEGAPVGNIEDPDTTSPGKFDAGWLAEIPPFENFNFLQKLFTQGLAHINEQGVAQWDNTTDYLVDSLAKGSNGVLYASRVTPNIANDPISSPTQWKVAFYNPNYYTDSGAADVYDIAATGDTIAPNRYMDGLPVTFRPDFDNTGASTVDVAGLGVKNIKTSAGADPTAGIIVAGTVVALIYDLANDWFEILEFGGGGQLIGNAAVKAISYNAQTIGEDLTIAADQNAFSVGDIEILDGFTVTIADGGVWLIG